MAPVIKRIIIFLFSLLIIVLLLAGAAKGDQLLSSKEFIKKELPLDQGNDKLIITEAQEYPKRTFYFDPLVVFDEQDEDLLENNEYEVTIVNADEFMNSRKRRKRTCRPYQKNGKWFKNCLNLFT